MKEIWAGREIILARLQFIYALVLRNTAQHLEVYIELTNQYEALYVIIQHKSQI